MDATDRARLKMAYAAKARARATRHAAQATVHGLAAARAGEEARQAAAKVAVFRDLAEEFPSAR